MTSDKGLHRLQKLYSLFEAQDIERGHFDVTFQFEYGVSFYIYIYILYPIS